MAKAETTAPISKDLMAEEMLPEITGTYNPEGIPVPRKETQNRLMRWLTIGLTFMIPVRAKTFPDRHIPVQDSHKDILATLPAGRELLKATTLPADAEEGRWFTFADDHYATRTQEGWRMTAYEQPSETRSLAMVIRSLRRSEQEMRLFDMLEAELAPEHQLHLQRFRDADATAAMIQTAWELNRAGQRSAWRDLSRMDEVQPMLDAFKGALKEDRQAGRNGKAVRAAFDEWFKSQARINARDAVTLADMGNRPVRFVGDEDASEALLASAIARLGWRPGLNYLALEGSADLSDRRYFKSPGKENSETLALIEEGVMGQIAARSLTEQRALQRQMNNALAYAALPLVWPDATQPEAVPVAPAEDMPVVTPKQEPAETTEQADPAATTAAKPAAKRKRRKQTAHEAPADDSAASPAMTEAEIEAAGVKAVADELGVDLKALEQEESLHKAGVAAVAEELGVDVTEIDREDAIHKAGVAAVEQALRPDDQAPKAQDGGAGQRLMGMLRSLLPTGTSEAPRRRVAPTISSTEPVSGDRDSWIGPDGKRRREPVIGSGPIKGPITRADGRKEPTIGDWSALTPDDGTSIGPDGNIRREPVFTKSKPAARKDDQGPSRTR